MVLPLQNSDSLSVWKLLRARLLRTLRTVLRAQRAVTKWQNEGAQLLSLISYTSALNDHLSSLCFRGLVLRNGFAKVF